MLFSTMKGVEIKTLETPLNLKSEAKTLFYSNVYGITFISSSDSWEKTRSTFINLIEIDIKPEDSDFIQQKKKYFKKELDILQTIDYLGSLPVNDVSSFHLDDKTKLLTLS